MKNKICLPKKIIQIFGLFFLIIGVFSLVNFINKTLLSNQKVLATYSCPAPNQEVLRTANQMCFHVCESYGGYLRQDFNALKCCCKGNGTMPTETPTLKIGESTPTTTIKPSNIPTPTYQPKTQPSEKSSCIFNPALTCPAGTTNVTSSGFCGCVTNETVTTKRCVSASYLPVINHPARVEEYKDGRWQTFEECLNGVCNPNTFQCTTIISIGTKPLGEKCIQGSECQSGECASIYTEPSGRTIYLFGEKCVYSISQQREFVVKKGERDTQTAEAVLTVAVVTSPVVQATFKMAIKYGIPTATNYFFQELQQPWVQNTLAAINVSTTLYALSDCAKSGTSGQWCNMLAAVASNNPGQFGQILGNDLLTVRKSFSSLNIGKYLSLLKTASTKSMMTMPTLVDDVNTVITYQPPVVQPQTAKGPWPIGQSFPSNRGGKVVVDVVIGRGGLGRVYKATLYEPVLPPKSVVIKFPNDLTQAELVYLQSEQFLLAKGQNVLPVNLRANLAKPYGFATVKTSFGEAQFPIIEKFGEGQTLSRLISYHPPRPVVLNQSQVDKLFNTAQTLDKNGVFLRDIFANNIYALDDGGLLLYDAFVPRFDPVSNSYWTSTFRTFTDGDVFKFRLNTSVMEQVKGIGWRYSVPTGNVDALNKMFQLYENVLVIK